jgi:uncharacterized protein (DUF58 family)
MERLKNGALLDVLRGVHWPARRISAGGFQGTHRSRRIGSSPEFSAYRAYRQGDDLSKVDWKLFGRTERVAIRLAQDESTLPTTVLVDASASMAFPPRTRAKWGLAASVAMGLCAVAHGGTDPVGIAVVHTDGPTVLPPRTRGGTVSRIARILLETTPAGSKPLAPTLARLRDCRRIAIVSDFLGDADELLGVARQLVAGGREVYAVHVVAREELEPLALGPVVVDPEDSRLRRPLDGKLLHSYQDSFARWREALAESWRAAGAVFHTAVSDEEAERVVRRVTSLAGSEDARG